MHLLLLLFLVGSCATTTLHDDLLARGYRSVALARNPAGHLVVEVAINGVAGNFILDTGAGGTVVDRGRAEAFHLHAGETTSQGAGAGASGLDVVTSRGNRVALAGADLAEVTLSAMDLSHVNDAFAKLGASAVDGVLGADLLDRLHAVIDYRQRQLFVRLAR